MSRVCVAWLTIVLLLLAGCTNRPPADPETSPSEGLPRAVLGHEMIGFQDCHAANLGTFVPAAWVEPFVGEGFRARAPAPGVNGLLLWTMDCDRMIHGNEVIRDVRVFEVGIDVRKDFGEVDLATTLKVEVFTNAASLVSLLEGYGIDARLVEIERGYGASIMDQSEIRWTISGNQSEMQYSYMTDGSVDIAFTESFETWFDGPTYTSLWRNGTYESSNGLDTDAVRIDLSGDSTLRALVGGNSEWIFDHYVRWQGNYTYTLNGGFAP